MLNSVCHHAQGQRLNADNRFFLACSIGKNTRQFRDLRDPAPIFFTLDFNGKLHKFILL